MDYTTISSLKSKPSLTIFLGMPNNEKNNTKYPIVLKNLITEAKKDLRNEYSDREITQLLEHLDAVEASFVPSLKAESVLFFISNEVNKQVAVPFVVESEYHISDRFTTKKLLRSASKNTHYYVLTIGPEEARLLEYQNDQLIQEIKDNHFPVRNKGYWTSDRILNSMGGVRTNYQKEFYKLIDSELQGVINSTPHPIVLAGVPENAAVYKMIANRNDLIVGEISGNFTSDKGESTFEIGKTAFEVIQQYIIKQKEDLIESLDSFNSKGRIEQDLVGIYMAAIKGKAQELIVDADYYQEATIHEGQVTLNPSSTDTDGYVEDLVNEIIYQVMRYGGEVVFTDNETLQNYAPIVLKTRY